MKRETPNSLLRNIVMALGIAGLVAALCGCVTVDAPGGVHVFATGNAKISVDTNGTVSVENSGTAEVYDAIGRVAGTVAEKSAQGAVKGMKPGP